MRCLVYGLAAGALLHEATAYVAPNTPPSVSQPRGSAARAVQPPAVEPEHTASSWSSSAVALATVLGLLLGLASGPQAVLAGGQALQGLPDKPSKPTSMSAEQRLQVELASRDKMMEELRIQEEMIKKNSKSKKQRVADEMAKMKKEAETVQMPP
eukprot:gb/GFBE01044199.1/.p1 GENE.gb/GFBE01044199.1/~~gb/GFBE01044199.1/.p1  ORF type:complete len:155 (+),score=36.82 gb/GFBE01044199.1/:1-465(+)